MFTVSGVVQFLNDLGLLPVLTMGATVWACGILYKRFRNVGGGPSPMAQWQREAEERMEREGWES